MQRRLTDDEMNAYEIARYVRMPGDKVKPFLRVMQMCGYQIRGPKGSVPFADHDNDGTVTAKADPHQD